MNEHKRETADSAKTRSGTGFWSVIKSVLAAGLGVQSSKNRKRDFTEGRAIHFIIGGLIATVVFVVVILLVVKFLLSQAT